MKFLSLALGAATFLAMAAPASANTVENDIQCLVVGANLMASDDEQMEFAGLVTFQYYLGRVDAGAPGHDLENAIVQHSQRFDAMSEADRKQVTERCGQEMEIRGKEIEEMGNRLAHR